MRVVRSGIPLSVDGPADLIKTAEDRKIRILLPFVVLPRIEDNQEIYNMHAVSLIRVKVLRHIDPNFK